MPYDSTPPAAPVLLRAAWPDYCLAGVGFLTLADALVGLQSAALLGTLLLGAYLIGVRRKLFFATRFLIAACAILTLVILLRPDAQPILAQAASRMIYLPGFMAVLCLLRGAASASRTVATAGRHLVKQRPSRRYIALTFGGHIFGVLFNIGGLALLLDMTRRANTLEAAGGEQRIVDIRERRMASAIGRGFAAIVFWSPLGVAFNLVLASIPGLTWIEVAPLGISCALLYLLLGWAFDRFQNRPQLRPTPAVPEPRGQRALLFIVLHVMALSLITAVAEITLGLSFQTVLLIVVPLYAFGWACGSLIAAREDAPVLGALRVLRDRGLARFRELANEIAVFATSGFLAVVLLALAPRDALQQFFQQMAAPPGVIAAALTVSVVAMGLAGINPLITVAVLASVLSAIDIPGLSPTVLALALVSGWTVPVVAGPMASTVIMTSSMLGRKPWEVVRWNAAFAATVTAIAAAAFILIVPG